MIRKLVRWWLYHVYAKKVCTHCDRCPFKDFEGDKCPLEAVTDALN